LDKDNKSERRVSNSLPSKILKLLREYNGHNSIVFYRLPNQTKVNCLIGEAKKVNSIGEVLNETGFAFLPASNSKGCTPYFIVAEMENVLEDFETLDVPNIAWAANSKAPVITSHSHYLQQAKSMIDEMKAHKLEKAILSRIKKYETLHFNPLQTFKKLCTKYPSVMVYWVTIPDEGTWLGATPETLIKVDNGIAQTEALAGTQADNGMPLEKVEWGTKEQEEQQIVADNIRLLIGGYFPDAVLETEGPITFYTGVLLHLITRFKWHTQLNTPAIESFIKALHPTPAIVGQPRQAALKLISNLETHDRAYYTGLLGPINPNEVTHLFVNLRCMQAFDGFVALYLGGGLTGNSDPDAEWLETELKAKTLLSVL
jgi:isochorismate synthase